MKTIRDQKSMMTGIVFWLVCINIAFEILRCFFFGKHAKTTNTTQAPVSYFCAV